MVPNSPTNADNEDLAIDLTSAWLRQLPRKCSLRPVLGLFCAVSQLAVESSQDSALIASCPHGQQTISDCDWIA
jgi:hypothetical protein